MPALDEGHSVPTRGDETTVAVQLGRAPRGAWRVSARCRFGRPVVIENPPLLEDGSPFPTLYWLTCPWLVRLVSDLESAGGADAWAEHLASDFDCAARLLRADRAYRAHRANAAGGADPFPDVGIAGQRDPLATKCLHAHVAARLAGIDDPVGQGILVDLAAECEDDLCAVLLEGIAHGEVLSEEDATGEGSP